MSNTAERLAMAHKISLQRSIRLEEFPHEMFDEHAWVMLLGAYERQMTGAAYSVADVANLAGASLVNGARWLRWLQEDGLIVLENANTPGGPLRLTENAIARLDRYLDNAIAIFAG